MVLGTAHLPGTAFCPPGGERRRGSRDAAGGVMGGSAESRRLRPLHRVVALGRLCRLGTLWPVAQSPASSSFRGGPATRRRRRAEELPTVVIHTNNSLPRPSDLRLLHSYGEYSTIHPQPLRSGTCVDRTVSTSHAQGHPQGHLGLVAPVTYGPVQRSRAGTRCAGEWPPGGRSTPRGRALYVEWAAAGGGGRVAPQLRRRTLPVNSVGPVRYDWDARAAGAASYTTRTVRYGA
jgi:hypothetical protein